MLPLDLAVEAAEVNSRRVVISIIMGLSFIFVFEFVFNAKEVVQREVRDAPHFACQQSLILICIRMSTCVLLHVVSSRTVRLHAGVNCNLQKYLINPPVYQPNSQSASLNGRCEIQFTSIVLQEFEETWFLNAGAARVRFNTSFI